MRRTPHVLEDRVPVSPSASSLSPQKQTNFYHSESPSPRQSHSALSSPFKPTVLGASVGAFPPFHFPISPLSAEPTLGLRVPSCAPTAPLEANRSCHVAMATASAFDLHGLRASFPPGGCCFVMVCRYAFLSSPLLGPASSQWLLVLS